jgi:hypothetical protein
MRDVSAFSRMFTAYPDTVRGTHRRSILRVIDNNVFIISCRCHTVYMILQLYAIELHMSAAHLATLSLVGVFVVRIF